MYIWKYMIWNLISHHSTTYDPKFLEWCSKSLWSSQWWSSYQSSQQLQSIIQLISQIFELSIIKTFIICDGLDLEQCFVIYQLYLFELLILRLRILNTIIIVYRVTNVLILFNSFCKTNSFVYHILLVIYISYFDDFDIIKNIIVCIKYISLYFNEIK